MGGRDHSYRCGGCGEERGGLNDVPCACEREGLSLLAKERMTCLASNLIVAAVACWSFSAGRSFQREMGRYVGWYPGCWRPAPTKAREA